MVNLFAKEGVDLTIERLNKLKVNSDKQWGKMDAGQMLAHCNVAYNLIFEEEKYKNEKPKGFKKFILKLLVKGIVVSEKGYKPNGRTAPQFLITTKKKFEEEKSKMITNLNKVLELGVTHFEGKESFAFGPLTSTEWNNMFSKHIDHHFKQFGV